jgi:hypothetical protein
MARKSQRLNPSLPALTLATLLACAASPAALAFQDEGTVRVGMLESQTGTYAPFGIANMTGTLIAFDEINAAGGVTVDGKKSRSRSRRAPAVMTPATIPRKSIALLKRALLDDKVLLIKGVSTRTPERRCSTTWPSSKRKAIPSSCIRRPSARRDSPSFPNTRFRNSFIENAEVIKPGRCRVKDTQAKSAGFFIIKDNPYYQTIVDRSSFRRSSRRASKSR